MYPSSSSEGDLDSPDQPPPSLSSLLTSNDDMLLVNEDADLDSLAGDAFSPQPLDRATVDGRPGSPDADRMSSDEIQDIVMVRQFEELDARTRGMSASTRSAWRNEVYDGATWFFPRCPHPRFVDDFVLPFQGYTWRQGDDDDVVVPAR